MKIRQINWQSKVQKYIHGSKSDVEMFNYG